jgi:AcrR family transcriptional regulator
MNEEPEPRARRRTVRRVVDWHQAAQLLAQGTTIADVARRVGCSRGAVARKRRHDTVFQSWMAGCREAAAAADSQPLADLRHTLHKAIEKEVADGNVRVILWLADRLKLVTPPDEHTPEQELRQLVRSLTPEELREFEGLRDAP